MDAPSADVTERLLAWRNGQTDALDDVVRLVYKELRMIARSHLRRQTGEHSLQPTALVHEAYLRLVAGQSPTDWRNRAHFFGVAAHLMRCVLVDHYRNAQAAKRGGGVEKVYLNDAPAAGARWDEDILALDQALVRLAALDPGQARIVELRFFAGLEINETSEVMGISPATVKNKWSLARAWLRRELRTGIAS